MAQFLKQDYCQVIELNLPYNDIGTSHCFQQPLIFQTLALQSFASLLLALAVGYPFHIPTHFTTLVKMELLNRELLVHDHETFRLISGVAKLGICDEALVCVILQDHISSW
jgi:hypothetical protein